MISTQRYYVWTPGVAFPRYGTLPWGRFGVPMDRRLTRNLCGAMQELVSTEGNDLL
jgi:hypothetical protein